MLHKIGDYEIVRELASGGMGAIHVARHPDLDREVALKTLTLDGGFDEDMRTRFFREAQAVARLRHPNVVGIHALGESDDQPYFVMDLIEGESLQDRLARGPLGTQEAAALTETLARAIEYSHRAGVVHRDLKPANVLLGKDGVPRLTDFGLARFLSENHETLTRTGQILGTPGYMAPEQAGVKRPIGPSTDVYGLGATLYAMLTGLPPFRGALFQVLCAVVRDAPEPPSVTQPVDAALEAICLRCLQKDPAARYPSAQALADALARYARGEEEAPPRPWRLALPAGIVGGVVLFAALVVVPPAAPIVVADPPSVENPAPPAEDPASVKDPAPPPAERFTVSELTLLQTVHHPVSRQARFARDDLLLTAGRGGVRGWRLVDTEDGSKALPGPSVQLDPGCTVTLVEVVNSDTVALHIAGSTLLSEHSLGSATPRSTIDLPANPDGDSAALRLPNGRALVALSGSNCVMLTEVPERGAVSLTEPVMIGSVRSPALSPDGSRLLFLTGTKLTAQAATRVNLATLERWPNLLVSRGNSAAFAKDGSYYVGLQDGSILLYDPQGDLVGGNRGGRSESVPGYPHMDEAGRKFAVFGVHPLPDGRVLTLTGRRGQENMQLRLWSHRGALVGIAPLRHGSGDQVLKGLHINLSGDRVVVRIWNHDPTHHRAQVWGIPQRR